MYILLELGMKIDYGDECLDADAYGWEPLSNIFCGFGDMYRADHLPMRRKIETLEELFTAYNNRMVASPKCQ